MAKFMITSICEDVVTTKEFDSDYLYDVVERFEEFLRGCGYFFDGRLDIVNECEDVTDEEYTWNEYCAESPRYDPDLPPNSWPFGIDAATFKGR
jgi:hypothetical protein